jgi:hypothetical protein
MPKRTSSGAARPSSAAPEPGARAEDLGDEFLAAVLIRMWALASGRTLRRDVPPDQLGTEELIAFWADDMNASPGRHARPGGSGRQEHQADLPAPPIGAHPALLAVIQHVKDIIPAHSRDLGRKAYV